jgi:NADH:ubiquinone oxidoreductase subunit K
MTLYNIATTAADHLVGRLLRRVLLVFLIAAFVMVAIYHFTIAGTLALETQYSALHTRLIVAGIYTAAAAITFAILWAIGRKHATPRAPSLSQQRERSVAMLVEAVMAGYSLARKGKRTR